MEYKTAGIFLKFVAGMTILVGIGLGGSIFLVGDLLMKSILILASGCTIASGVIVFITSKFEVDN